MRDLEEIYNQELLQAKINLYSLLLQKSNPNLSHVEIELMFQLSQDTEVQKIIQDKLKFK